MARLPIPGEDSGRWGHILNEFLRVELQEDGSLREDGSIASRYRKPMAGIPIGDLEPSVAAALSKVERHDTEIARILGTTLTPLGITDEAPAINAALAAAPTVGTTRLVTLVGTFTISQPLVVRSDTIFDLSRASLTLNPGSNCSMIRNQEATGTGRDRNITILLGTYSRPSPNAGSAHDLHSIRLRKIDGLIVRGGYYTSTDGKFAILLQNCTDALVDGPTFGGTHSDGVHLTGPLRNITVRNVSGTCGDDLVALVPLDYTPYVTGDEGDCTNIHIEQISGVNTHKAIVKVLGGKDLRCTNVVVDGVFGTSDSSYPVIIGHDSGQANTASGWLDGIAVQNVAVAGPTGYHDIFINANGAGRIDVRSQQYRPDTRAVAGVVVSSATTLKALTVTDIGIDGGRSNAGYLQIDGAVDTVIVNRMTGPALIAGACGVKLGAAGNVKTLQITNCWLKWASGGNGSVVRADAGTPTLSRLMVRDLVAETTDAWLFDLCTSTQLFLDSAELGTSANALVIRATGAIVGRFGKVIGTLGLNVVAGGTLRSTTVDMRVDVSKLTKAAGDMAYNTNAGLACGVGPVICDGTTWKNLYSGATY